MVIPAASSGTVFLFALALGCWAWMDMRGYSAEVWSEAGQDKTLWCILLFCPLPLRWGAVLGPLAYLTLARPRLLRAELAVLRRKAEMAQDSRTSG